MNRQLLPLLVWAVLACGCDRQPEREHLVSWYADHDTERKAKIAWCSDDAERSASVDCQNAEEAHGASKWAPQSTLKPIDWGASPSLKVWVTPCGPTSSFG